jgi:FkbM family methyltransferase
MLAWHGQLLQDAWVASHLKYKRSGFFVDIGAHDGVEFSNTYAFERNLNWSGICIEPVPEIFDKLVVNRECKCVKALVHQQDSVRFPFEVSGINTMLSGINEQCKDPIYMESKSLMTILAECNAPKVIDYISLDTEGSEPDILRGFNPNEYHVQCWTIEHNGDGERASFIAQWLSDNGYLFRFVNWDIFAVKDWANP